MRKIIAAALAAVLTLCCFAGCTGGEDESGKPSVIVTIFPQYDFVRQIAGELVDLRMLIVPGAESHGFEATLDDIASIQKCDLFVYVGGESEEWVDNVLSVMDDGSVRTVAMTDVCATVGEELVEGMEPGEEHDEHEEHEEEADEHVWTSPVNAMLIAVAIRDALCEIDPDNADAYAANAEAYLGELTELDARFREVVENGKSDTIVFAERFPFRYLAEEYGLEYYAAFAGCSSNTEPSLSTITFLTQKVEELYLPAIFYIEFSTETVADTIAQATGAQKLLFHSCHNVSEQDFEDGVTYVELMRRNADNLAVALG